MIPLNSSIFHTNYQRGLAPLIILSLLKKEDMYGYQLVQETERSSQGKIITQEGSLYPVLYKLEQSGFISSKKVLVGKKMTRVYYHLEPKGVEYLKVLVDEYETVTQGMFLIIYGQEENICDSTEET